ncbi:hypothetical protein [Campylobacter jejuni]|uniref:hypothetical protein n=1 Tax=Campylobacter jejuni TaxID=197 RepID=UPI00069C948B|nr:hypothetical protein [Campylobacter jejuni]
MLTYTNELVVAKLSRALAYKEAKKDKSKVDFLINLFKKQIRNCIKATEHFTDRVSQRFEEVENDTLSVAISRAIRNTSPLQRGADYHIATTQKYFDEDSNIVVVLERQGEFGAVLVTTYNELEIVARKEINTFRYICKLILEEKGLNDKKINIILGE